MSNFSYLLVRLGILCLSCSIPCSHAGQDFSFSEITEAFANSKHNLQFRLRYENLKQQLKDDSFALTL